jgi:hypothetical protein
VAYAENKSQLLTGEKQWKTRAKRIPTKDWLALIEWKTNVTLGLGRLSICGKHVPS